MQVGRDVESGFEILNDHGDMIGAAYRDDDTGRVDVNAAGFHGQWDQMPKLTQDLKDFAEAEYRRRDAAKEKT